MLAEFTFRVSRLKRPNPVTKQNWIQANKQINDKPAHRYTKQDNNRFPRQLASLSGLQCPELLPNRRIANVMKKNFSGKRIE